MSVSKKEEQRLADAFIRMAAEWLVESGIIDPRGKSGEDLQAEVFTYLRTNINNPNVIFAWAIDHTPSLLREARAFVHSEQREMACLFYAIWFEHWINDLIATFARRKKLSEQEITQIIREIQFRGKSTWLLHILGLKPINEIHLRRMQSIIEARNAFVHYKWKLTPMDDGILEKEDQTLTELLSNVEKTVSYLQKLKNQQIYFGKKRKIVPR